MLHTLTTQPLKYTVWEVANILTAQQLIIGPTNQVDVFNP